MMKSNSDDSGFRSESMREDIDNLLEQEGLGIHLSIGLSRDIKLVGQSERNLSLPHQLFVRVIWREGVFT